MQNPENLVLSIGVAIFVFGLVVFLYRGMLKPGPKEEAVVPEPPRSTTRGRIPVSTVSATIGSASPTATAPKITEPDALLVLEPHEAATHVESAANPLKPTEKG